MEKFKLWCRVSAKLFLVLLFAVAIVKIICM